MGCCKKCGKMMALLLVIIGVLFVLQDNAVWHFWNLSWYTVAFLLAGLSMFGCGSCKSCCMDSCDMPAKKKGKKKK